MIGTNMVASTQDSFHHQGESHGIKQSIMLRNSKVLQQYLIFVIWQIIQNPQIRGVGNATSVPAP